MRASGLLVAALAVLPSAFAAQKSAIVWFDDASTPDSIINQAKQNIIDAGGEITHVYTIIKGFAVIAPETALETIQTWGTEHSMRVEEDEVVTLDH